MSDPLVYGEYLEHVRPLTPFERNMDIGGPVYGEYLEYGGLRAPIQPSFQFNPPVAPFGGEQMAFQQSMGAGPVMHSTYNPIPTSTDLGPRYGPYDCAGCGPW